jgi:uracil phosphoribosyltransferase|tara:strand:- start:459 stop:1106 length:648 start_codon:yes stop_codon:yes gene_type:complete
MLYNLSDEPSIVSQYLSEIRDIEIQKDPMRFRSNLERIASVLGYEASKNMKYTKHDVQTPLGVSNEVQLEENPVLITILRAGLAMHNGLLNTFDRCESAFVSAYRSHTSKEEFSIEVEYLAAPNLDGRVWIISDPMLASGNSMVEVYKALLKFGKPKKVIVIVSIATPQSIKLVENELPRNTDIWTAAVDPELTSESYIVPGLGDAGDLAFGVKV